MLSVVRRGPLNKQPGGNTIQRRRDYCKLAAPEPYSQANRLKRVGHVGICAFGLCPPLSSDFDVRMSIESDTLIYGPSLKGHRFRP